jgi:hypothetical protein
VVEGGALSPLISIANYVDLETQRCIAYALCNLGSDIKRRKAIVQVGYITLHHYRVRHDHGFLIIMMTLLQRSVRVIGLCSVQIMLYYHNPSLPPPVDMIMRS